MWWKGSGRVRVTEVSPELRGVVMDLASVYCENAGIPFIGPFSVSRQDDLVHVCTRSGVRGGNARIVISLTDMSVIDAGYADH